VKKYLVPISILLIAGAVLLIVLLGKPGARNAEVVHPTSENSDGTTTIFAKEADQGRLSLEKVTATRDTLTLQLSIAGLALSTGPGGNFESLVCDPYITSTQNVVKVFSYQEVALGDPTRVTYQYALSGNSYDRLDLTVDWTIGPCSPAFDESNVTPVPQPLMVNSHFTYSVPVN
jgi:hypothetical protein